MKAKSWHGALHDLIDLYEWLEKAKLLMLFNSGRLNIFWLVSCSWFPKRLLTKKKHNTFLHSAFQNVYIMKGKVLCNNKIKSISAVVAWVLMVIQFSRSNIIIRSCGCGFDVNCTSNLTWYTLVTGLSFSNNPDLCDLAFVCLHSQPFSLSQQFRKEVNLKKKYLLYMHSLLIDFDS